MRGITVLIASALINLSVIPGLAAVSTLSEEANDARAVSATVHSNPYNDGDNDKTCRAYAASFYASEMRQQAAVGRLKGARMLTAIDTMIDAFKNVFATKCEQEVRR